MACGDHRKTLTIETGILCNNRCVFCYQRGYRAIRDFPRLVPGEAIRERMRWAAANGYDEVSFTGGEPTVRPDFLELVAYARELGMRRVAITTNGWRLARPEFFAAAAAAGLTSLGVSIHGSTAEMHDRATRHPGSFLRAVQTVRNAMATLNGHSPVHVNTFTVVSGMNRGHVASLAGALFGLGVRLMVLQPVILGKANLDEAAGVALDLPDLVDEVAAVVRLGIKLGFRTKLFNLPPCLFGDVMAGVETDQYQRTTFRQDDTDRPATVDAAEEDGYVRLDACATCAARAACPGLNVTLLPQEDLACHFEACLEAARGPGRRRLWVCGTDLLGPAGVGRVVGRAREAGFAAVGVTHGGSSRGGADAVKAALDAGAAEVVLVHHGREPGSGDRILCHAGNDAAIQSVLATLMGRGTVPGERLALLVSPTVAGLGLLASEAGRMAASLGAGLRLRAPWREGGPGVKTAGAIRFLTGVARLPWRFRAVQVTVPAPRLGEMTVALPLMALLAAGQARFDLSPAVLWTAFLDPRYSIVNWSVPGLGHENRDLDVATPPGPPLQARTVQARPLTQADLAAGRRPSAAPPGR